MAVEFFNVNSHPEMFRNRPVLFIGSIVLVPVFGAGLIVFLVWWLKTRADAMILTDDRVIKREGLFSKYTAEISYGDIKSIQIKQSFWDRVFDVGSIGVASSGQHSLLMAFHGYRSPERIKSTIEREVAKHQK